MRRWAAVVACTIAVALAIRSVPLAATVVVPTGFREVVAGAALIVRGRVHDVRGVPAPDGGIDSIATIGVTTVLKGAPAGVVYVRVPGGVIGRDRIVMVGAPVFRPGDEAVFFLRRASAAVWIPVALSAGIVRVTHDGPSGQALVTWPIVNGRTAAAGPIVRGDGRRKPVAVAEFEGLVRLVIAHQTGRRAEPR
jgi:hypothetical protein